MAKISRKMIQWRRKQKPQSIMTTEKFEEIKERAAAGGATNPEAVAGSSYWKTARAKYLKRKMRKGNK